MPEAVAIALPNTVSSVWEERWLRSAATQLLLGDHVDGILKVEVILLGDLGSSGMRAVRVKLRYPDAPEGWK